MSESIWRRYPTDYDTEVEAQVVISTEKNPMYGWFEVTDGPKNAAEMFLDFYQGGLWFEMNEQGEKQLYDYDGVYSLPMVVMDILKEQGVNMDDFTEDLEHNFEDRFNRGATE